MIGILDLGAGNIKSVKKALDFLGFKAEVVSEPEGFKTADRLVLPGVGSFGYAMDQIRGGRFLEPLRDWLAADRPLLGICLGLQLLAESSEESPGAPGFGVFRGTCRRFQSGKVPHIGWNNLRILKDDGLFSGLRDGEHFYFAHSYHLAPGHGRDEGVLAVSEHGTEFSSVLRKGKVCGVQFHPEKSGPAGLRLIENWVERCSP